ncbi:MAG: racemase [Clostridia bacterium]|nr:racemase [Clostridia bacterium]
MLKKALEKLNDKQRNYCDTQSRIIARTCALGLEEENERNRGRLRGFLECLCQSEIITGAELKALYLYFVTKSQDS